MPGKLKKLYFFSNNCSHSALLNFVFLAGFLQDTSGRFHNFPVSFLLKRTISFWLVRLNPVHLKLSISYETRCSPWGCMCVYVCVCMTVHVCVHVRVCMCMCASSGVRSRRKLPCHVIASGEWAVPTWVAQTCCSLPLQTALCQRW